MVLNYTENKLEKIKNILLKIPQSASTCEIFFIFYYFFRYTSIFLIKISIN